LRDREIDIPNDEKASDPVYVERSDYPLCARRWPVEYALDTSAKAKRQIMR
jgi:hypothetical protein